jgi:hypothetical protein
MIKTTSSLPWRALPLAGTAAMAATLAACAAGGDWKPSPPSVAIPDALRAPAGESLVRTLKASGVQIYECRQAAGGGAPAWAFVAPEATLVDSSGAVVVHHYAGPSWEAGDGSKVVGVVTAKADAPDASAIPWLLLQTHSTGKPGAFAKVSSVQRVATAGGVAPVAGCDATAVGRQERVPYTAEYAFYAPAM